MTTMRTRARLDGTAAQELVVCCRELTTQINALEREFNELAKQFCPRPLVSPGLGAVGVAQRRPG